MKKVDVNPDDIVSDARNGMTYTEIARKYGISASTASRIGRDCGVARYRQDGESQREKEDRWYSEFCEEWEKVTKFLRGGKKCIN